MINRSEDVANLMIKTKVFFLTLLVSCVVCSAQEGYVIDSDNSPFNLSSSVEIFEDTSASLSLDQVKTKTFKKNNSNRILLPFSDNITWLKLELTNKSADKKDWIFYLDNPLIRSVTLYNKLDSSVYCPFEIRDIGNPKRPNFEIKLKQGESQEYYFKLESVRGNYFVLQLFDSESYESFKEKSKISFGFMNGLNLMTIFVVVVVGFLVVKDSRSKAYVAYVFFKTISLWSLYNVLGPAITKNPFWAEKIAFIGGGLIPMIIAILLLIILPLDKLPSYYNKILFGTIVINVIILFGIAIQYNWVWLKLLAYFHLGVLIFAYFTLIYTLIKKTNKYPYYAIPFLIGSSTSLILHLRLLGYIIFSNIVVVAVIIVLLEMGVYVFFLSKLFRESVKKQAEKLQYLSFEAEKATQLKELNALKSNFFTNVSHELRTPLTLISGPVNDLVQRSPEDPLLQMVQRNTGKLQHLVNQILDVQKLEAKGMQPEIQKGDMAEFLRLVVSSFRSLSSSKSIQLTYDSNIETIQAYYDADKLEKVLNNLLINAFKFTPSGGKISVKVRFENLHVFVSVSDTGKGIGSDRLPFIFDRFYHDKGTQVNHVEGTGIGLSLVKDMISLLKGSIEVQSEQNLGTTFKFHVPIDPNTWESFYTPEAKEPSTNIKESPDEAEDYDVEKGVLLIVEDNEDMQEYIKLIFQHEFTILQASNGVEGLRVAQKEIPDIIISDLMMPQMDGFQFSKRIKSMAESSHVPIVMLTAKSSKESKLEGYDIGIDHYLQKPFDKEELKSIVKNTLENRKLVQGVFSQNVLAKEEIKTEDKSPFMNELKSFLEIHYSDSSIGVKEMALHFAISDKQLRRKLKALSGFSPNEFLRKYRLNKAAQLILKKEYSISEIAFQVGFEHLSYFSRSFQDEYHVLPSEYAE